MHLVVIQHGLWGAPGNTAYLSLKLREELKEGYFVLNSDVNVGNLTYDGIDVCGDRLHALVVRTIEELSTSTKPVRAISMVGYSMGGLITRYVAGKLYAEGYLDTITPVNFVTVATPHLGAWRMPSTWYNRAFNFMVPVVTSRSGYQLVLQDKHLWGKPLLCLMSHPDLLFMRALRCFRKLMLLANVFHDRPVPYCTAAIRLDNPYELSPPVPIDAEYPSIVTTAAAAAAAGSAVAAAKGVPAVRGVTEGPAAVDAVAVTVATNGGGRSSSLATNIEAGRDLEAADGGAGMRPGGQGAAATGGRGQPDAGQFPAPSSSQASQQQQQDQQQQGQQQQQQHQAQQQPQRPLRSTYLRFFVVLFLPLALPALLFMVITGRSHHCKIMRTALDFSWIQRHHDRQLDEAAGGAAAAAAAADGDAGDAGSGGGRDGSGGSARGAGRPHAQEQPQKEPSLGSRRLADIECPSAPDLPAIASTSAALVAAATTGGRLSGPRPSPQERPGPSRALETETGESSGGGAAVTGGRPATTLAASESFRVPRAAAGAGAAALGLDDDGQDEVVVSEQTVLLHDGIVELPAEVHRVQEWMAEQLNRLPWHKVDVDCRDYHAHAAIVMRNPARFRHCADAVNYLCAQFQRA